MEIIPNWLGIVVDYLNLPKTAADKTLRSLACMIARDENVQFTHFSYG